MRAPARPQRKPAGPVPGTVDGRWAGPGRAFGRLWGRLAVGALALQQHRRRAQPAGVHADLVLQLDLVVLRRADLQQQRCGNRVPVRMWSLGVSPQHRRGDRTGCARVGHEQPCAARTTRRIAATDTVATARAVATASVACSPQALFRLPVNSGSSGSSLSGSTDVSTQKSTYLRGYVPRRVN